MSETKKTVDLVNELIRDQVKNGNIKTNDVSDGYHTFGELYRHRIGIFILATSLIAKNGGDVWKSIKHSDGSIWDEWFILGVGRFAGEQITYHLPLQYWDKIPFAKVLEMAPEWDGHTSDDVLQRIEKLCQL